MTPRQFSTLLPDGKDRALAMATALRLQGGNYRTISRLVRARTGILVSVSTLRRHLQHV